MSFDIAMTILRTAGAVDEHRDLVTEVVPQLVELVVGVLDGVVQEGRGDRDGADAEVGEDLCHGDRVRDVRLAGLALLPVVGPFGHRVGPLDQGRVGLRVVRAEGPDQGVDGAGRLCTGEQARQERTERTEVPGRRRTERRTRRAGSGSGPGGGFRVLLR
jgi:hypothetical protein